MKKLHDLLHATSELRGERASEKVSRHQQAISGLPILSDRLEFEVSHGYIQSYPEMAGLMYPEKSASGNALYQLTHRVKKKSLDQLASEDISERFRNEYDKKRYLVQRNFALAEAMILKGFPKPGWELMKKIAGDARKYALTHYANAIYHRLTYHYALQGKHKAYRSSVQTTKTLSKLLSAETEADILFCELSLLMRNKWHFEERIKIKVKEAHKRMQQILRTNRSHNLWLAHFRIAIYYEYACQNYHSLLEVTRRFRHYLLNNPHLQQDARWAELAHHEMNACMALRNFVYGIKHAEENKKFLHPNNHNWMLYMENFFQMLMHAGRFEEAQQVYSEVTGSRYWQNRSNAQRELWKIKSAYLHFALNDRKQIELFMPARFLNQIAVLKKDKQGLNFALQVAELMYLLAQDNADRLSEFGHSFHMYTLRNISRRRHYRSYYFSKLLLLLYRYNFDIAKAERIGKKFHDRLLDFRRQSTHDRELTELIPYDQLWPMMLRVMKSRT
jgi:hypothetical protein